MPPLEESEGEELFVERARTAGVELAADDRIPELCRRLEELPLALELAAARTAVFSPAQLLERLPQRLDLLRGLRDLDWRQQTLRATIEWSYELLDEPEQRVYRALSVFPGGCTYEAAEDVALIDADILQSLVDKSLVRVRDDGGRRYWMLETIREHAREHLEAAGEAEVARRRLADWLLDLTERGDKAQWSAEYDEYAARVDAEHANIVETVHWLLQTDRQSALVLATHAATTSWDGGARGREGRLLLELTLSQADSVDGHARALALFALGRLAWVEDDRPAEKSAFRECIELARGYGDTTLVTQALVGLGWAAVAEDALDEAHRCADAAEAAGASEPHLRRFILQLQGVLAERHGNLDNAARLHEQALGLARSVADWRHVGQQLGNLAWVELQREHYDSAASYCREALAAIPQSDLENRAYAHGNLGLAALFQGDDRAAADQLAVCLEMCRRLGMKRVAAETLTGLAALATRSHDSEKAIRLWVAADGVHAYAGSSPTVIEERLRSRFLEPLETVAALAGVPMTLEEAVGHALEVSRERVHTPSLSEG